MNHADFRVCAKMSVELHVQSRDKSMGHGRDAKLASVWKDAIQTQLSHFHQKQCQHQQL